MNLGKMYAKQKAFWTELGFFDNSILLKSKKTNKKQACNVSKIMFAISQKAKPKLHNQNHIVQKNLNISSSNPENKLFSTEMRGQKSVN